MNFYYYIADIRSNSLGTASNASSPNNPLDVFGSLISDTEEHFRLHGSSDLRKASKDGILPYPIKTPLEDRQTKTLFEERKDFEQKLEERPQNSTRKLYSVEEQYSCPMFGIAKNSKTKNPNNFCEIS